MNHRATYSPEDDKIRIYLAFRLSAEDYAPIKDAGYHSAPRQGCVFAVWSPKAEDIALELCGEIEDEDKSLVQRAEERADRFEDYSDSRLADAESARAAVARIADGIPLGQPILVGHHSERHARRDAQKIENGMRRAVNMWKTSTYWKERAAGAREHAKYKERPDVRARRIKTLEAELRRQICRYTPLTTKDRPNPVYTLQQRWNAPKDEAPVRHVMVGPPGSRGSYFVAVDALPQIKAYCARYEEHLMNRLEYEHAMLEEQGATVLLEKKGKSAVASLPLCNYRAPGGLDIENEYRNGEMIHYDQIEMTRAQYAAIYSENRGTRVVDKSHRVRVMFRLGGSKCVFITDSKVHERPAPLDKIPAKADPVADEQRRVVREARQEYREACGFNEPRQPEITNFDQLEDALKAGVKVVSVPQLFPTPAAIAAQMIALAEIEPGMSVLEPSAGTGVLLDAIPQPRHGDTIAVEMNRDLVAALSRRNDNVQVIHSDFLELEEYNSDIHGLWGSFDRVVMNPPFADGSDIKHIEHAMGFLNDGGRLVALCANGPRQRAKLQPIADAWIDLPAGSFKDAGTMLNVAIFVYQK